MFYIKNLLENEFFPSELPPCFNTTSLARHEQIAIKIANSFNKTYSIPLKYSGYKSESSRRKFSIPNPYHYCKAIDLIVQNQTDIAGIFKKSKYSLTAPISKKPKNNQSYSKRSQSVSDTRFEIEKLYQDKRYEIRLDISSFFDNIYTHSISWAIHGIDLAKRKKNDSTLLGNRLDKCIQALNYNQTNGILVGNALSRIISEIILCSVDYEVQKRFPGIECCRFVDDYYIYTNNSFQIQEIISFIRICLAQYELNFNENKLQINESPFLYEKPWVEEIKRYIHLQPEMFLSKLIVEYNLHKDIAIFKYGLKIIALCDFSNKNWQAIQSRTINLWVRFPSLADRILPILWKNKEKLSKHYLKRAIYSIIKESLQLNRDQELVWALWYAKLFNIELSQEYIIKVLDSKNDLAIIVTLDIIYQSGKQSSSRIKQRILALFDELEEKDRDEKGTPNELLWTSHWLLAYECTRNGWLNVGGRKFDFAAKNQFFKELLKLNVEFYDPFYHYDNSTERNAKIEYVTRVEFYKTIKKLKGTLLYKKSKDSVPHPVAESEKDKLFAEFLQMIEDEIEYI